MTGHGASPAPACRGVDPEIFFPEQRRDDDCGAAKTICSTCSVSVPCLVTAIERRVWHGIWGGFTPTERRILIRDALSLRSASERTIQRLAAGARIRVGPAEFIPVVQRLSQRGWTVERLSRSLDVSQQAVLHARTRAQQAELLLAFVGTPAMLELAT